MSNSKRPYQPELGRRESRSGATPIVVAVSVLVCIAAVVAISLWLKDDTTDAGGSTPAVSSTPPGQCSAAPAIPTQPETFDSAPDPALAEDSTWIATVTTNCGDITLQLDGHQAPQTVASFIYLSQQKFFDDSPCHRLVTAGIFVLQCGDPTGAGPGGPGYQFGIENAPTDGTYPTGSLAMARTSDPDSNGSQFFIVYKKSTISDPTGYSIFGKVTQGLDIVKAIAEQGVDQGGTDGAPAQPISILGVSVEKAQP